MVLANPSPAQYEQVLSVLLGFQAPMEDRLDRVDWEGIEVGWDQRRGKARWLEADLARLGWSTSRLDDVPRCAALPTFDCVLGGLGALYVVEGGTLGGPLISRGIRDRLGLTPDSGLRYFTGYGRNTARMFRRYLAVAEDTADTEERMAMVAEAAVEAFAAIYAWCAPRVPLTTVSRADAWDRVSQS